MCPGRGEKTCADLSVAIGSRSGAGRTIAGRWAEGVPTSAESRCSSSSGLCAKSTTTPVIDSAAWMQNGDRCSAIEGSLSDHAPSAREITSYRSRWWVSVLLWPGDRGHQWAVLVAAHGQFLLAVDTVNPGIHRSHPDQGGGEPIQPPTAAQTDSVESNPFFVAQQVPGADVQLTGCS